jgi:DNA-binding MarR family transcriptional regulator
MEQSNKAIGVSEREHKCLAVLAEIYDEESNCYYMRHIAKVTGLDLVQVRRSVRALARKGLAEYVRGLFDEDGMVAGSGYCCTRAGFELINAAGVQQSLPI